MAAGLRVILIMDNWESILGRKIIDLSLTFVTGKRGVLFDSALTIAENGFNTTNLHLYSHALTHMDAPKHFINDGWTIEAMDLEKCMGQALVIDLSHKGQNSHITVEDLAPYHDRIDEGSRLLLRTDWDQYADEEIYRTDFPRISEELAQWFVDCGVWFIGVETPSVASLSIHKRSELTSVHQILLSADITIVESLCNLRLLPEQVHFIALPLKLEGVDGSPVRAVALIED